MQGKEFVQTRNQTSVDAGNGLADQTGALAELSELLAGSDHTVVLSGAGCSTASGIPDYRDGDGKWKRPQPVQYQDFVTDPATRQRYWARSFVGWQRISTATPNQAHHALAALEASGRIAHLVTQNVDGLHQRAGSQQVTDLHGRLDNVECLGCGDSRSRAGFQAHLDAANSGWRYTAAAAAPDGDADLDPESYAGFNVPACAVCTGILKPSVVFFGESVPRDRVEQAWDQVNQADLLLIAGSSLMVFSGFRFARGAAHRGVPVAAINLGRTRADDMLTVKVEADCGHALAHLRRRLGA